jgi:hypothetical protein
MTVAGSSSTDTKDNILELSTLNDTTIHSLLKSRWEKGQTGTALGYRAYIQTYSLGKDTKEPSILPMNAKEFARSIYKQMLRSQQDQSLFLV